MNSLSELVLNMQRMADNARLRGDDLKYVQQQETYEHIQWLDHQLTVVEKVRAALMHERAKFMPVQQEDRRQVETQQPARDAVPKFIQQGPRATQKGAVT